MVVNGDLPYWQVNVPENERTAQCPEFLLDLSEKDRGILSTPNSEYQVQGWDQVTGFVKANKLEAFQRWPSDLRKYRAFIHRLKKQYGSVQRFIFDERLQWESPVVPKGDPFENPDDIKILFNDWPYGIDPRIVHLVVWTKFSIEDDPTTGYLTDRSRGQIEAFVDRTFRSQMPADKIIWFKNWASLKSVNAIEHFHVMLMDPSREFIEEVTHGDVPSCDKVSA